MSATAQERAWSLRTILWIVAALVIAGVMAALTYYYHVHEDDDEDRDDQNVAALVVRSPAGLKA
jgi:heme/copper-type cytochrome/quinol oxidase subunit 2